MCAVLQALSALSLAIFALAPQSHIVDCGLALMEQHAAATAAYRGGTGTDDDTRAAALRGAALLASLKDQRELGTRVLPRWLPLLTGLLAHPSSGEVRLAAGEFVALLWESAQAAGPGTPIVGFTQPEEGGEEEAEGVEGLSLGQPVLAGQNAIASGAAAENFLAGGSSEGRDGGGSGRGGETTDEEEEEEEEDDGEAGGGPTTTTSGRGGRESKAKATTGKKRAGEGTTTTVTGAGGWDWRSAVDGLVPLQVGLASGFTSGSSSATVGTITSTVGGIPVATASLTSETHRQAVRAMMSDVETSSIGGTGTSAAEEIASCGLAVVIGIGAATGPPEAETSSVTEPAASARIITGRAARLVLEAAAGGPIATEESMAAAAASAASALPSTTESTTTTGGAAADKSTAKSRRLARAAGKEAKAAQTTSAAAAAAAGGKGQQPGQPTTTTATAAPATTATAGIHAAAAEPPSIIPTLALAYAPSAIIPQLKERIRALGGDVGAKHRGGGSSGQAALRAQGREVGRTVLVSRKDVWWKENALLLLSCLLC